MCLDFVLIFRSKYALENFDDYGAIWGVELHRYVISLAMYGELTTVRLSPYADAKYIFELAVEFYRFEVNHNPIT